MSKKVLLVDDDLEFLKVMGKALENAGFDTIESSNIDDAAFKTKKYQPDLVILDIMFPAKSGWELAAELRSEHESGRIPILFISGKPFVKEQLEWCLEIDGFGFLEKPFTPQTLVKEADQALKQFAGKA